MQNRWPIEALLIFMIGCSGRPGAIRPPAVDPDDAAEAAIELYDKDSDGQLSKAELLASPALAAVAQTYDTSSDGNLSAAEISEGIGAWQKSGVGARPAPFVVRLDGRPLSGATIRIVPAPFLGEAIKPASGEASGSGAGQLSLAPEDRPRNAPKMPLVQPGLYQVEITHPSKQIPAKFNSQTTLGIEITRTNPGPEGIVWSLTSK